MHRNSDGFLPIRWHSIIASEPKSTSAGHQSISAHNPAGDRLDQALPRWACRLTTHSISGY